jgi:hypothetical protein
MKFSLRQILASSVGAVLAAVVASVFGIKGTIVGVAIGSIAATTGTALVFQSIERTNKAVKQVAVRAPESSLLRRLGGTDVTGITESTPGQSSAPTEETATSAAAAPTDAANAEESDSADPVPSGPGGIRWPVVIPAIIAVFIFSLVFVTVVEVIAGRPLADIFGRGGRGTTVERIFENTPTTLPPPTSTTTTPSTSTSTTTTVPNSSTTTSVGGSTTSTTGVGSTSTTSPSGATTATTTTVPGTKSP